jgi:valyl-tRNA synthetase
LINQTYDQKEILLNNIFLKQIWNATRLCIQKDFLPKDIEECLNKQPKDFEDFDIVVLDKLKELLNNRETVKTYKDYIEFFNHFKESIQNIFFSRYLEIQKVHPTKDVQFVSAYFFNFLLTILYPLIPEFVDALQYISEKKFIQPIKLLEINKTTNYNMNILYNIFIKIKQIKIGCNIKQHESCNLFIKSIPAI